jgi:hypothetical protein
MQVWIATLPHIFCNRSAFAAQWRAIDVILVALLAALHAPWSSDLAVRRDPPSNSAYF